MFCMACIGGISTAYASSVTYSNVLDDLKKDSTFSADYYPTVEGDNSLQVIQIAESEDKELFVYVYQPSGQAKDLRASSINISLTPRESIKFDNYTLTYLNSNGTLYKYLVDGLTVSDSETRYYTITSIYRQFDSDLGDTELDNDNEITEVPYKVEKEYCFTLINDKPYVRVLDIETIEITDKFVGFVRYPNGFEFYLSSCDSHFVAFNTDKDIDRLIEADVYYTFESVWENWTAFVGTKYQFGENKSEVVNVKYDEQGSNEGGFLTPTYIWNRIQTVDEFLAEITDIKTVYSGAVIDINVGYTIDDSALSDLKSKTWVLRFKETDYTHYTNTSSYDKYYTSVGNVSILRLMFETDGQVYNLGVIDNKQTGGDDPINDPTGSIETHEPEWWVYVVLALLVIIVLSVMFPPVLNAVMLILRLLLKVLMYLLQGLWFVLSAPFKAIAKAIAKRKNGGGKK